ncbi:MAG: SsrA-binding protein SmpB [Saprospiraceae bacterium]|nr:SsrA-binding protein SmpB [Saprospiraceae bacterium]
MKLIPNVEIVNRKATHEFFFVQTLEVGVVLQGTEVKSIRMGRVNMNEAFCRIQDGEMFLHGMHIAEYNYGTYNNHATKRSRKLLLKKREIRKFHSKVKEKGYSIVPHRLFLNERGFVKLEIALAKGKNTYDKRHVLKEKDAKRSLQRAMKERY